MEYIVYIIKLSTNESNNTSNNKTVVIIYTMNISTIYTGAGVNEMYAMIYTNFILAVGAKGVKSEMLYLTRICKSFNLNSNCSSPIGNCSCLD